MRLWTGRAGRIRSGQNIPHDRVGTGHDYQRGRTSASIWSKTEQHRTVRLLDALAKDALEYKLAAGQPSGKSLILLGDDGEAWDKTAWQMWRVDRWAPACRAAGLEDAPRPYDLRHSFASLLLAEGRQPLHVARQLGHSVSVLLSTYAHLIDEYQDRQSIDADVEIAAARRKVCSPSVRTNAIRGT
jgi:integrase